MVSMKVEIGQRFKNIECCGENPIITEYFENMNCFKISCKCDKCGATPSYGMPILPAIREQQIEKFRRQEAIKESEKQIIRLREGR